jgi:AAA domain, putative AbiEii toxin, Type IV TA system
MLGNGKSMLRLRSLKYEQGASGAAPWSIDWNGIGDLTMIVGTNTTGKTRLLNIIRGLSKIISGSISGVVKNSIDEAFDVKFDDGATVYRYDILINNGRVIREILKVNDEERIVRRENEAHKILTRDTRDSSKYTWVEFGIADNVLALVAKRDTIQYDFLEPLINWAENVEHYSFTSEGSGVNFVMPIGMPFDFEAVKKLGNQPIPLAGYLMHGNSKYPGDFGEFIVRTMGEVAFPVSSVQLGIVQAAGMSAAPSLGVEVTEVGRTAPVPQNEMSSGMLRALAVLIKLRLAQLGQVGSLLLDDVGEGLDYERSVALIKLLMVEAQSSNIQLFMTTNDRFVMNEVPLKYWAILSREGGRVTVADRRTEGKMFEKFMRLGLTNFDLFRSITSKERNGESN